MALKAGDIVGGMYTVDEAGPAGGMAQIWRAWHRGLQTWHALKLLDPGFASDAEVRERFLSEARIQARHTHPHIMRVTDVIYEEQRLILVMDWAAGGDLESWLEDHGTVAPQQAVQWTIQLLRALGHVHQHGIVHRDVKPANLLLSDAGDILLTDFGVAQVGDGRRTLAGVRIGTPDYMSPEQLRDASQADSRADLFSAGAILYELITGAVATRTPDLLGEGMAALPQGIARVLVQALQPDPDDRFSDAEAFIAALEADQAVAVLTAEVTEEVPLLPRRRAWVAAPVYLLLGASAAGLGAWGWLGDDDGDGLGRFADACPMSPEDVDGFEDADGCPEADNDQDGIPDADDRCPLAAEDLDGIDDGDGCPDEDDDNDGVADASDACPTEAEDVDGFADGDGCPDPDNDGDHFLDDADRCPNQPESDNGLLDNDGCPDPEVAVGELHSCGLGFDGRAVCWGVDEDGRGGARGSGYLMIRAAADHTCALTASGDIECWGRDQHGEAPALATGPFRTFDTNEAHTCAVAAGGRIRCWGQVDDIVRKAPQEPGFAAVSVGLEHACALDTSGGISCWGGDTEGSTRPPDGRFVSLSAGGWHTCGLRKGGRIACWGFDGDNQSSPPGGTFTTVQSSRWHSCGVRTDGLLRCWGFNGDGQAPGVLPGNFHQISLGRRHGCGVQKSGAITCWGDGSDGQTQPPNPRGLFYPG